MPKSAFVKELGKIVEELQKTSKMLDVQHISADGMPETIEVGVPFNKALSYMESAKELVDQARKNMNKAMQATESPKKKPGKKA